MVSDILPVKPLTLGIAAVVIIFVGLVIYLVRRRLANQDETDGDSTEKRTQQMQEKKEPGVPIRTQVGGLPIEAKLISLFMLVVLGFIAYNIWKVLRTGSPVGFAYTTRFQMAVVGVILFGVGIAYERRRSAGEGAIRVKREGDPTAQGDPEVSTYTIYFDPSDVRETDNGLLVTEYTKRRFFGLYRRPVRIGERSELLNDEEVNRPTTDKVVHLLDPSSDWVTKVGDSEYVVRTKRQSTTNSRTNPADYHYHPPFSMSVQRKQQLQEDNEMLRNKNQSLRTKYAQLSAEVQDLKQMIKNSHTSVYEQFKGMFRDFNEISGNAKTEYRYEERESPGVGHSTRRNGEDPQSKIEGDLGRDRDD